MKKITPTQTFRNATKSCNVVQLVKEIRRPLQTSFKESYSVSLPTELAQLLRTLRSEYNLNVSAELLEPIKAKAIKLAIGLNKKMAETQQNGVDS